MKCFALFGAVDEPGIVDEDMFNTFDEIARAGGGFRSNNQERAEESSSHVSTSEPGDSGHLFDDFFFIFMFCKWKTFRDRKKKNHFSI